VVKPTNVVSTMKRAVEIVDEKIGPGCGFAKNSDSAQISVSAVASTLSRAVAR
jgi:hypothetical protein